MTLSENYEIPYFRVIKNPLQHPLKMWKNRWERVVQSNGDYFEGCHGPDDEE